MSNTWPLDAYTREKIDAELHKFDELYWPKITAMRVKTYYPPDAPVPPQQPQHLLNEIEWYAERLFKVEADHYEHLYCDPRHGVWLSEAADRIRARVMKSLSTLETGEPGTMILGYHGLVMPRIEERLRLVLAEQRRQYEQGISDNQRGAALVPSAPKDAYAKAGIDLSSASPLLKMALNAAARGDIIETPPNDALKAKRKALLDSYRESFPDVKLADIYWAAKQTRREWTRWLGGEAKNGQKADRSFRHVLTSGKTPEQIAGKPRPTKYNV